MTSTPRAIRRPTSAPYFSLARGALMPYAVTWDERTGEFCGVEGPRGFASYREAAGGEPVLDAGLIVLRPLRGEGTRLGGGFVSARRCTKVVPPPKPPATCPEPRINHGLLDETRKEAYVLLLALDGILHGVGDQMHAEKDVDHAALSGLAAALSVKLATIGRQTDGAPQP